MDFAKQKTEGESGINGYRSLYSERCPLFCGRGGEASDIFCAALSLTRLRRELPPGVSLGLSVLFVWCVPEGFVGVACQGQSLRLPSAATVSLRLGHTRALTTHCVVIHYPRAASLPLHKGGTVGSPFIPCVTVLFAPTIASLREGGGFCEAKDGRRERNKRLSIVIFRALSFVCGRGGEASDIFCAALSLSHLRCQLSPGESLGLSVLFVWCVTVLFAGIVHCTREENRLRRANGQLPLAIVGGHVQ